MHISVSLNIFEHQIIICYKYYKDNNNIKRIHEAISKHQQEILVQLYCH